MTFKKNQEFLDNLKNILEMSSELLENFSDGKILSTLQKRSDLLNSLEKSILNDTSEKKFDSEIKLIVDKIKFTDKAIMNKIKERMDQIKKEINNLYTSSRAATAYSVYKSNKTRSVAANSF